VEDQERTTIGRAKDKKRKKRAITSKKNIKRRSLAFGKVEAKTSKSLKRGS
jgi:hypothetical protein